MKLIVGIYLRSEAATTQQSKQRGANSAEHLGEERNWRRTGSKKTVTLIAMLFFSSACFSEDLMKGAVEGTNERHGLRSRTVSFQPNLSQVRECHVCTERFQSTLCSNPLTDGVQLFKGAGMKLRWICRDRFSAVSTLLVTGKL